MLWVLLSLILHEGYKCDLHNTYGWFAGLYINEVLALLGDSTITWLLWYFGWRGLTYPCRIIMLDGCYLSQVV